MNYINNATMKKLKPDRNYIGLVPLIFSLLVFALVSVISGFSIGLNVLGAIMWIYAFGFALWTYIKTSNSYFLVSFFYLIVFGLFLISFEPYMLKANGGRLDSQTAFLIIVVFATWLILAYLLTRKKFKWRGREVMELAAWDVEEGEDSYTDRPKPVGKIDASKYDIIDFAKYLKRNLVFMSVVEENRVVLSPVKMGDEFKVIYAPFLGRPNLSWVAIDFEGNVSVHISKNDYLDYIDDLSFDHLSQSLGDLVIEFYDQHSKHDEVRIMDKIDTVKLSIFS